jgi:hypothetical protein
MKIANVIHEKPLVNHTAVKYVNYIDKPVAYDTLDHSLPTLYVGWSFMKLCNPNNEIIQNADILKKKIITNELYWEFSYEESKSFHVKGVQNFVGTAPQFYFQPKYSYTNLDPVFFQIVDIDDLMAVLPKSFDRVYNFKDEMLYVFKDNKIWGINLKMYEYFQFNVATIIERVCGRSAETVNDSDGMLYITQYKIFPNFTHLKRYLVVILTK